MQQHPFPYNPKVTFVTPPLIGSRCRIDWHKRSTRTSRKKDLTMPLAAWKSPQELTKKERSPRSSGKARIVKGRQSRRNYHSGRTWDFNTNLRNKTDSKKRFKMGLRKSSMKRESRQTWTNHLRRLRSRTSNSPTSSLPRTSVFLERGWRGLASWKEKSDGAYLLSIIIYFN